MLLQNKEVKWSSAAAAVEQSSENGQERSVEIDIFCSYLQLFCSFNKGVLENVVLSTMFLD